MHYKKLRTGSLRTPRNFNLVQETVEQYARRFRVRIEQISIQYDHIHLLVRTRRRSRYIHFFRVVAGQIAQRMEEYGYLRDVTDTPGLPKLWKHRPFTRIVLGWRGYWTIRNYIQLNEKEAMGEIPYRKTRLRGLSLGEWARLWL